MDFSVKPADVFSVYVRESESRVCAKQMLSEASFVVTPCVVFRCSVAGISGVKLLFTVY